MADIILRSFISQKNIRTILYDRQQIVNVSDTHEENTSIFRHKDTRDIHIFPFPCIFPLKNIVSSMIPAYLPMQMFSFPFKNIDNSHVFNNVFCASFNAPNIYPLSFPRKNISTIPILKSK